MSGAYLVVYCVVLCCWKWEAKRRGREGGGEVLKKEMIDLICAILMRLEVSVRIADTLPDESQADEGSDT